MLKSYPYDDLVIYEIGAGNGTLANDVLDYVRDEYPPEVYERVRYNIIEISPQLAALQRNKLIENHPGVRVVNKSIFDWAARDSSACFFIALEVVVSTHPPIFHMVLIY
jgi:SAM-dependent MidA family methyltransferase